LREKVAAERRSVEGSTGPLRKLLTPLGNRRRDPSSVGFADTFSRKGTRVTTRFGWVRKEG
jgi:hypothetical protein